MSALEKFSTLGRSTFPAVASDLVTFRGTGENDTAKGWRFIVSRADIATQRARGKTQVPKRNTHGVLLSHVWNCMKGDKARERFADKHGWPFTVHLANLDRCKEVQS